MDNTDTPQLLAKKRAPRRAEILAILKIGSPAGSQTFWSPGTGAFYDSELHGDHVPKDAVPITDALYCELRDGRAGGKDIALGADGKPTLIQRVLPLPVRTANARATRDEALRATDALAYRHREQASIGGSTTLTEEQYKALCVYRQALRDHPTTDGFPDALPPAPPPFLSKA